MAAYANLFIYLEYNVSGSPVNGPLTVLEDTLSDIQMNNPDDPYTV